MLIKGSTLPPLILSRGHWARASVVCLAVLLTEISIPAPAVATQEYADIHESLTDAWWTGPILAASASTLPQGHILVEPYLYDSIDDGHLDQNGKRTATPRAQTFSIGVWSFVTEFEIIWNQMAALGAISALVPVALLLLARRYVISALTFGAVREKA